MDPPPAARSATVQKLRDIDEKRRLGTHIDRSVLTLDGALPQIQSLCGKPGTANEKGVIHEFLAPQGNDVIKGSAACSMSQNANDVGRCHSQLKAYARTKMKWDTRHVRDNMRVFIENVIDKLNLDKGSLNTVLLFCGHLEDMICKVWQAATIRAGWKKAGLVVGGDNREGGINIKTILGHWIGTKDLTQANVDSIVRLVPTMAREVVHTTTVSDQSMQQLEKFYPKPFLNYRRDRAAMSTSRGRSSVLLANEDMHRLRLQLSEAPVAEPATNSAPQLEPPPQLHGWKNDDRSEQGERICDCKAEHTTGARFYRNNAKAWEAHQKTKAHLCWASGQTAQPRMDVIGVVPFVPFANHPIAQQQNFASIAAIAHELALSFEVAQNFAVKAVDDQDLQMFALMRPDFFRHSFGVSHALACQFSARCRALVEGREFIDEATCQQREDLMPADALDYCFEGVEWRANFSNADSEGLLYASITLKQRLEQIHDPHHNMHPLTQQDQESAKRAGAWMPDLPKNVPRFNFIRQQEVTEGSA